MVIGKQNWFSRPQSGRVFSGRGAGETRGRMKNFLCNLLQGKFFVGLFGRFSDSSRSRVFL